MATLSLGVFPIWRQLLHAPAGSPSSGGQTMTRILGALAILMAFGGATAVNAMPPAPLGTWFTENHRAAIALAPCGGALCGRIVWIDESHPPPGASGPPIDRHNPDPALRNRPLCGLEILRGFVADGDGSWGHGRIYNPQDGDEWRASLAPEGDDRLRLRGYVLVPLLGQTQVWTRVPASFTDRCRPPEVGDAH